ncbi:UNVERIFIED_CONTAM: protein NRT1/ PTR FAMILY 5.9 [Sesamum calycinum]|uniref:Protein NRT1/ PTR FAMILY 5.9 n=1 Tax=Sesamum calycinum TaxID=2727403 RepID=A0AAW2MMW1_9LAMI
MERFAFKGVASNLVTYLTDVMGMSNSSAAKYVNGWVGFTSMLPLIVATLADSYWDRYSTIFASSVLYAAGLLALTSTAVRWPWIPTNKLENEDELPHTNNNDSQSSDKKSLFFQCWYFGVCCGSLLGVSVMSYIQDTLGWGLGFAIPTLSMIVSILMFLCGNRFYMRKQSKTTDGKSLEEIVQAIKASVSKMINGLKFCRTMDTLSQDIDHESGFGENQEQCVPPLEAARIVLRLLPVWIMLLMFAVIFQQPVTFFTKQGMTMKRNIGSKFKIPPAALQSAITVSIIILMPWYDMFFIPLIRNITRNEKGISVMQRMGIGMFLSVIAMIIAAITERRRLEIGRDMKVSSEDVPFSIFWLLPQYILLGISDIFTVVGMQEFFYSEVPVRMRTMGIALYTSVFGVGSFLSAFLIYVIEYLTSSRGKQDSWFSDDMAKARLDKYYWFLALSSSISLLAFVIFCIFSEIEHEELPRRALLNVNSVCSIDFYQC